MLKTFVLAFGFLGLGFLSYQLFFGNTLEQLEISDGLWIESERDSEIGLFSSDPFIIEKVPQKDLILFTQISDQNKNRFYQLVKTENMSLFVKLEPDLPCTLEIFPTKNKLRGRLDCSNKSKKSLTFIKSGGAIFNYNATKEILPENEIETLKNIAKIENINKDIHNLKANLLALTTNLKEENMSELISNLLYSKAEKASTKMELITMSTIKKKIEETESERKNILRVSNYGSEVELGSRINNIEWQTALKHWFISKPVEQNTQASPPPESPPLSQENIVQPLPNTESQQGHENEQKPSEWWKEF